MTFLRSILLVLAAPVFLFVGLVMGAFYGGALGVQMAVDHVLQWRRA